MLAVVLVAALAATALGSPSGSLLEWKQRIGDTSENAVYTVQVLRGGNYLGPAALISDHYAICAAHILGNYAATSLTVKAGTTFKLPIFNPFGQNVAVANVLVHPDASLGVDVAVLELAKPVTIKSAKTIAVVDSEAPSPGSLAVVSGWGSWQLAVSDQWLVLPKYCNASAALLCATGDFKDGELLNVDGQLVGLASSKSRTSIGNLVAFVDLAAPSVQKFIAAATYKPTERPITTEAPKTTEPKPVTTTVAPSTTKEPTEAPTIRPSGKKCSIRVKGGLPRNEPILLYGDDALAFHDPDTSEAVVVAAGERIRLVCSGQGNYFRKHKGEQVLVAECVEDDEFLVKGKSAVLDELGCKSVAANKARRAGRCGNQGQFTRIQIGFEVGDDFITQIENCFNGVTFDAVYSRSNMTPALAGRESGVQRPNFSPGDFYEHINPNSLYQRDNQRNAIGKLLGDQSLAYKYIRNDNNHVLSRGHLSAKADYALGAQQLATFYYVNAAPQWQTFNGNNWEKLESSLRAWVISSGRSVQVVTGTWGVATLPNRDGVETELYLEADRKYMRVPKYYWKVVYDPASLQAAAFVGLNNPYHEASEDDVLCQDVCSRYTWLRWSPKDQEAGVGFCCDVNELRKVITTIPADLDVHALL